MRKTWMVLLCLLLLSGCGKEKQSAALQSQYAAMTEAELAAEIAVHLPDEIRQYQVNCSYSARGDSHIVITAPDTLAGIEADVSGDESRTVHFNELAFGEHADLLVDPADDPGDRCLAGTRIAGEYKVQ